MININEYKQIILELDGEKNDFISDVEMNISQLLKVSCKSSQVFSLNT